MRRILLDTTGIYYAANAMKKIEDTHGLYSELSKSEYDALFNVVSAIVLWNEFGTIEGGFGAPKPSYSLNGMYYFNKYEKSFSVVDRELVVHPQSESKEIVEFVEEKDEEWTVAGQPEELNELFETLTADWKVEERVKWCLRSFEARRALSYLLIANKNDMDYLPSIKRQAILQAYDFEKYFSKCSRFSRKDVMSKIDAELEKYYDRVNERLTVKRIEYSAPILIDYLMDKYPRENLIDVAFELREKDMLVKFRNEMDEVENAYISGDIKTIDIYFAQLERMMKKISDEIPTQRKISVTLSIPPSIAFDLDIPRRRLHHFVFLKDLVFYGIHNRKPQNI